MNGAYFKKHFLFKTVNNQYAFFFFVMKNLMHATFQFKSI
jgi:hypothetical protein